MKKILMILTSSSKMENTDATTGVWLGGFTEAYYELIDKGYEITLASLAGGEPPIDPLSRVTENLTESNKRFGEDEAAQLAFRNTVIIEAVKAEDFDGVFFVGGHGVLWDIANKEIFGQLVLDFYNAEKPIVGFCHGAVALANAATLQPGFLKDKRITAFTSTEDALSIRANNIPFSVEKRLKELGADFRASSIPLKPHIEVDGVIITGQNPLAAGPTVEAFINALEKKDV